VALDLHCLHDVDTFAMDSDAQLTKQATFAMGNSAQEAKQATFAMGNISLDITRCG